jgi:hypothetical protein
MHVVTATAAGPSADQPDTVAGRFASRRSRMSSRAEAIDSQRCTHLGVAFRSWGSSR